MRNMTNDIKEKLRAGQKVLGSWCSIPSTGLVEVIAHSGLDFIILDAEHGPLGMETAQEMARVAEGCGLAPLVRVPANQGHMILRALDIGAHGVHIPHVATPEDAQRAVRYSKYHPLGERGYSPFTRAGSYGLKAAAHAEEANKNTMVVVHIEGVEGIRNLKDIVKVKGLDVVFIGPYDLSQSLGKPGQTKDGEVVRLVRESARIIQDAGLVCGSFAGDKEYFDILCESGARYLTYMLDTTIVLNAYRDIIKDLRGRAH